MKDRSNVVTATMDSPVGQLRLAATPVGLCMVNWDAGGERTTSADPVLEAARRQLDEYFEGRRRQFDLPLDLVGTAFQLKVWRALADIAYGALTTYGALAASVGRPRAARPVGGTVGRNPVAIVLPCHRVVGADGSLTGFGGGLDNKRILLELEGVPVRR